MVAQVAPILQNLFKFTPGVRFPRPTSFGPKPRLESLSAFFRNLTTAPRGALPSGQATARSLRGVKLSRGDKINIALGTGTVGAIVLTQTPGGVELQDNILEGIEEVTDTTEQLTNFFGNNPIVLPLLIGLGIIVAIK